MCNFLSAIYTATGKLICEPVYTDSHSDLLDFAGIKERDTTAPVQQFVKLELTPPDDHEKWLYTANWTENVDEHEVPAWFDAAARFSAFEAMRDVIAAAICDGSERLQLGRLLIVRDGRATGRGCRFFAESGSNVTAEFGSNVTAESGSNVTAEFGSNVTAESGSNVTAESGSNVTAGSGSNVTAKSGSNVTAWFGSNVTAEFGSNVTAKSGSNVTAWFGSNVTAEFGSNVTEI